jgi:hypothetical protein
MKEMCRDFVGRCLDCDEMGLNSANQKGKQNTAKQSEQIQLRENMLLPELPELEQPIPMNQPPVRVDRTVVSTPASRTATSDCNSCVIDAIGLAQAYVPYQPEAATMAAEQSLVCGTVFPSLVKPYVAGANLRIFQ